MSGITGGLARALAAAAWALALASCGDTVPAQRASTSSDLCLSNFQNCVMPVLNGQIRRRGGTIASCMDSNCHVLGGSGGQLLLVSDATANYEAIKSSFVSFDVTDESKILAEPLQDDQMPAAVSAIVSFHGGLEIFPSRTDNCYVAISNWINEKVASQSACGVCTPIATTFTSCGYPP